MPKDSDTESRRSKSGGTVGTDSPTVVATPAGKVRTAAAGPGNRKQEVFPAGPTVIAPRAVRRKAGSVAPSKGASPAPAAAKPTAIPGFERRRIAAELADLRRLAPQVRLPVAERALRLVETFVVEGVRDRQAVLWGHRLQQDYSDLVSQSLELAQADLFKRVAGYLGRMTEILVSIDIEAVCGAAPGSGALGGFFKKVNRRIDTPEELDAARAELDQLVRLMGDALEALLSFKERLEKSSKRIEETGDEVEAAALAAQFLSEHLNVKQRALSQRFLDRSISLTQTVAQIRGSTSLRESQIEQPLRLIAAIQNVALVMVPGWLGSIAALTSALATDRKLTPTEAGELAYQLRNIVQQLKA